MNIKEALEVVNSKELKQELIPIDKNYVPQVGDILSNSDHALITIETVYSLNRTSYKVNKNYNDQLAKYEILEKIIYRKEIIWNQHKFDFKLFPETSKDNNTANRDAFSYARYCFYNDFKQYHRLYESRYRMPPLYKQRVMTGYKAMVRVNHGLCKREDGNLCYYWGGKKSVPLSSLRTQKFIYRGNIYTIINKIDDI